MAIPDLDAVNDYLGDHSWSDADVAAALAAETAAQAAVCTLPDVYPDDMAEALLRRVARNLAMRAVPLSVQQGDVETQPVFVPRLDPEIRRYEAPYRRLVVG